MQGIIDAAKGFAGYMGSDIIRPDSASLEYVIIFRFDSYAALERWQRSEERRGRIEKSKAVVEDESRMEVHAGLDFWFTPRAGRVAPRYKMALIVIPVISVLLLTLAAIWLVNQHRQSLSRRN